MAFMMGLENDGSRRSGEGRPSTENPRMSPGSKDGQSGSQDGCESRGSLDVKLIGGDDGETAASNPNYTKYLWWQTADEVTLEMPVRTQTERRGFECAQIW